MKQLYFQGQNKKMLQLDKNSKYKQIILFHFGSMSISKIGMGLSPYVQQLKRDILHDALYYNIREREAKQLKKHLEKQKQIQQFCLINKRVSAEISQQRQKKLAKKNTIKNILAHEYDKKIQQIRHKKQEQIKQNRTYAQAAIQNQDQYHQRRSRQIARMFRAQKTFQSYNPQAISFQPYNRSRISTQVQIPNNRHQEIQQYYQHQIQPTVQNHRQKHNSEIDQLHTAQGYKDYLLSQIEKKKSQKQHQVQNRLQLEKSLSQHNYETLERQKQQQRQLKIRYKQMYKKQLEEQIAEKKNLKNRY